MAVVDKDRVVQLLCSSDWKHAFFFASGVRNHQRIDFVSD